MEDVEQSAAEAVETITRCWKEAFENDALSSENSPRFKRWGEQRTTHLPATLRIISARLSRPAEPHPGRLILCIGLSEEQLALSVALHARLAGDLSVVPVGPPETWVKVRDELRELLAILETEVRWEAAIHTSRADPAEAFRAVLGALRETPAWVDTTGGQKPMSNGAAFAASYFGAPTGYLGFDDYSILHRRPLPWTARYAWPSQPDGAFALEHRRAVLRAYERKDFASANALLEQALRSARQSGYLDQRDVERLEKGRELIESARLWMSAQYHRLGVDAALRDWFDAQLQSAPQRDDGESLGDALSAQPNVAVPYMADEYWRIGLLLDLGQQREALIALAGLAELAGNTALKMVAGRVRVTSIRSNGGWFSPSRAVLPPHRIPPGTLSKKMRLLRRGECTWSAKLHESELRAGLDPTLSVPEPPWRQATLRLTLANPPLGCDNDCWSRSFATRRDDDGWRWVDERHMLVHSRVPLLEPSLVGTPFKRIVPRLIEVCYRLWKGTALEIESAGRDDWLTWRQELGRDQRLAWFQPNELSGILEISRARAGNATPMTTPNPTHLVVTDVPGIQSYLMASVRLREIQGASSLISAHDEEAATLAAEHGGFVVYAAGGACLTLFPSKDHAQRFTRELETALLDATLTARFAASDPIDLEQAGGFDPAHALARASLEHTKRSAGASCELLTMPLARRCASCGIEPASERVERGDEHRWLGLACKAKHDARRRSSIELLKSDPEDDSWAWLQERHAPDDFAELVAPGGDLGIVVADVDGAGARLTSLKSQTDIGTFSKELSKAVQHALATALRTACDSVRGKVEEKNAKLPVEVLFAGGDDLLLACRHDLALPICKTLSETFHPASQSLPGGRLGMSSAAVIVRPSFPFRAGHDLAKRLLGHAKDVARTKGWPAGAVDFAVVTEASADADRLLADREHAGGTDRLALTGRPYQVDGVNAERSLTRFQVACGHLSGEFPRGKLVALRSLGSASALGLGPATDLPAALDEIDHRLSEWRAQIHRSRDHAAAWKKAMEELNAGDGLVRPTDNGEGDGWTPAPDLADGIELWGFREETR